MSLKDYQQRVEKALLAHLPQNGRLADAMRYAVLNGGKRFRAGLIYALGQDAHQDWNTLDRLAMAIEALHAYSLIHDDLPAMDNDDFRRGKPSCHKQFDEATAILAGDALQAWAFSLLGEQSSFVGKSAFFMVEGQMLDMEATGQATLDFEAIQNIYYLKTGALFQACFYLGLNAPTELKPLGYLLGEIYQIQDDILDVTQTSEKLGKTAGKDVQQDKNTILKVMSLDEAQTLLEEKKQQLFVLLKELPQQGKHCQALLNEVMNRTF